MPKKRVKKSSKKVSKLELINEKLDKILRKEDKELKEESRIEKDEKSIKSLEKKQIEELEQLESELRKEIGEHPLRKVTQKDVTKGLIGAFIAVISHFAFVKGVEVSHNLSLTRISLMYLLSFIIGATFLYATGYRKVKQIKILKFLPVRVFVIYLVSIVTVVLVLSLFNQFNSMEELFRQVGVLSLLAIVGASAADLIGKD